jgi:Fe-Mn family superoxide dismutase
MAHQIKQFHLSGLHGISDETLQMHFKLYEGYVRETNRLIEQITKFLKSGRIAEDEMPVYSELKRRLGFEYNGMVLHEYYFGNLTKQGGDAPSGGAAFRGAVEASFGSFDAWRADLVSVGKMRGVGWAICYQDPLSGQVSNHWITLHETGNVTGFKPLVVLDVWEHAFLLDYKPAERSKYIDAFFANLDWNAVDERLQHGSR